MLLQKHGVFDALIFGVSMLVGQFSYIMFFQVFLDATLQATVSRKLMYFEKKSQTLLLDHKCLNVH